MKKAVMPGSTSFSGGKVSGKQLAVKGTVACLTGL